MPMGTPFIHTPVHHSVFTYRSDYVGINNLTEKGCGTSVFLLKLDTYFINNYSATMYLRVNTSTMQEVSLVCDMYLWSYLRKGRCPI